MRQGNDVGIQYRSVVSTFSEAQQKQAEASRDAYQHELDAAGFGAITTEIREARPSTTPRTTTSSTCTGTRSAAARTTAPASAARSA